MSCRGSSRPATFSSSTPRERLPPHSTRASPGSRSSSGSRRRSPTGTGWSSYGPATDSGIPCPRRGRVSTSPGERMRDVLAPYGRGERLCGRTPERRHWAGGLPAPPRGSRSDTATCASAGRSRPTRPSSPSSPAARRCRARGGPSLPELVTELVSRGIIVAPIVLHTGVSSPERGEAPYPERYRVPATTARARERRPWLGRQRGRSRHDRRARPRNRDCRGTAPSRQGRAGRT